MAIFQMMAADLSRHQPSDDRHWRSSLFARHDAFVVHTEKGERPLMKLLPIVLRKAWNVATKSHFQ